MILCEIYTGLNTIFKSKRFFLESSKVIHSQEFWVTDKNNQPQPQAHTPPIEQLRTTLCYTPDHFTNQYPTH